jgi:hypothetical protein
MSTPAANTFPSEAGSIDTGIAEAERVTATVSSEEVVETGPFTATVTAQAHLGSNAAAAPDPKSGAQAPPKFLRPDFDRMPPELKSLKNWLLWAPVRVGTKWTKRPVQISDYGASSTEPRHWSSFDDAKQAYERAVARGYMELRERGTPVQQVSVGGVGFVFDGKPDADGLVFAGVDFDKVISGGEIASLAAERIKRIGSYTERSVSGGGLHVIVKARALASGIVHGGVEMYTSGRYFTMTGRAPENARIVAAPFQFGALVVELQAQIESSRNEDSATTQSSEHDTRRADYDAVGWFDKLPSERRSEVIKYAALHIANNSKLFELTRHGGNYQEYLKLTFAIARSGVGDAEAIFVEAALIAKDAEPVEELRNFFQKCASAAQPAGGITVGTMLHMAQQNGADFDKWKSLAQGGSSTDPTNDTKWPDWPDPLDFHRVPIEEAVARVNAAGFFVLTLNGDIYRIERDGGLIVQKRDGFNNLFACRDAIDGKETISAGFAWKTSRQRREYQNIGYYPGGHHCPASVYNLFQGWGIDAKQGDWSIINHHVLDVLACGDKVKADYILDWCAHMVQRPWEKPGVALVFRGRKGTGKTLLTLLVATAIGRRNALITANGKKLFGTFNWHLADKLLIGAEEAFFVGNRELNDQLKHLLTGDDIEVEQKFGQRISMKSMHRMIMTSNHDQVISASDDERRFFVCDVSEARRGDDAYFAPLVAVTKGEDDDTLAAFMYELHTRDIKNWKPERAAREVASASGDLARQKLLSLEPPLKWLLETILSHGAPTRQTAADIGYPCEQDRHLDECATSAARPDECRDEEETSIREQQRSHMLDSYRQWVKTAQVRGASDFTGAENFWASIKRLLNNEIFPGRKLFRSSGGTRMVKLPPRQEMFDGFNRLLGGKVLDADGDQ